MRSRRSLRRLFPASSRPTWLRYSRASSTSTSPSSRGAPPPSTRTPDVARALSRETDLHPFLSRTRGRHLPGFYPLFVELMHSDAAPVRQVLQDIFASRVGAVLQGQPNSS